MVIGSHLPHMGTVFQDTVMIKTVKLIFTFFSNRNNRTYRTPCFHCQGNFLAEVVSVLREKTCSSHSYGLILPRLEPGGGTKIPQATGAAKTNKKKPQRHLNPHNIIYPNPSFCHIGKGIPKRINTILKAGCLIIAELGCGLTPSVCKFCSLPSHSPADALNTKQ